MTGCVFEKVRRIQAKQKYGWRSDGGGKWAEFTPQQRQTLQAGNVGEVNIMLEAAQRELLATPRAQRKALKKQVQGLKEAVQQRIGV